MEEIKQTVNDVFEDNGQIARYNKSRLPKKIVNKVVIHGMSAVHGGEDMLGGLFGPLPIFEKPKYRYLIYSFKVTATKTKDPRIAKHGRICSVFLILKKTQQKYILNNHLSIEKMVKEYKEKTWIKELDVTNDSIIKLYDELNDTVKVVGLTW